MSREGGREMVEFSNDWDGLLADELQKPYFQNILAFLNQEYRRAQCYPPPQQVFRALRATPYEKVRAVILGQDPYHGPGQAHGLCSRSMRACPCRRRWRIFLPSCTPTWAVPRPKAAT